MNLDRSVQNSNTNNRNITGSRFNVVDAGVEERPTGVAIFKGDTSQPNEFEKILEKFRGDNGNTSDDKGSGKSSAETLTGTQIDSFIEVLEDTIGDIETTTRSEINPDEMLDESEVLFESKAFGENEEDSSIGDPYCTSEIFDMSAMAHLFLESVSYTGQMGHLETTLSASVANTPAINEAAARIYEEMQTRVRRGDTRRWEFSLPGLMGGEVSIVVDNTNGQLWNVELTLPDGCTDEDRLALEKRLHCYMDDISLNLGVVDE